VRLLAALCLGAAAQAAPPLPARNLSVEMRIAEDDAEALHDAAAAGSVVLGTAGRVEAAVAAVVQGGTLRQRAAGLQQVLVLNGARAMLQLSEGALVDDAEVAWTPWGPGAVVRSRWVEVVNGIEVAPRWPGGSAPVTVAISAQRVLPAAPSSPGSRGSVPGQWTVVSTVQLPLDEWVSVAQLQARRAVGTSSGFGAATRSRQRSLQLRVSLP
jgi:hypothetical protein